VNVGVPVTGWAAARLGVPPVLVDVVDVVSPGALVVVEGDEVVFAGGRQANAWRG